MLDLDPLTVTGSSHGPFELCDDLSPGLLCLEFVTIFGLWWCTFIFYTYMDSEVGTISDTYDLWTLVVARSGSCQTYIKACKHVVLKNVSLRITSTQEEVLRFDV